MKEILDKMMMVAVQSLKNLIAANRYLWMEEYNLSFKQKRISLLFQKVL
jgi:hypothetical protein